MASTAGKNGGIVSQTQGPDLNQKGIWSAKEQQSYRKQVVGKTFEKDTGYLANQIKALNEVNKIYAEQLASLDAMDKKQAKAYQKRMAENTNLRTQLEKMYEDQEGSIENIQEVIRNSNKQLKKSYKELGEAAALALEQANEKGKQAAEDHLKYITDAQNKITTQGKEIELTLKNAEKSTKNISKGFDESISKVISGAEKAANVFNLQALASNKFLDKANEQFDALNKINLTLGYSINQSRATYSSLSGELQNFNANVGNLFNMDDMKQYIQSANTMGLSNEQLLKDNLKNNLIQQKYFGVSSDTQAAMYNFMKRTDTTEISKNFNKTIISLIKQNIGINQDQLNAMTKEDLSITEALGAAGLSAEQQEQFLSNKTAMTQILSDAIGEGQANALSSALNDIITNQGTTEGRILNYQRYGSNVDAIIQEALYGNMSKAFNLLASGTAVMESRFQTSNISNKMLSQNILGRQAGTIASSKAYLDKQDEINENFAKYTADATAANEDSVDQWIKTNTAVSGIQKVSNWLGNKFEKWFGDTNMFYMLGTAFFGIYTAASFIRGIKSIFSGVLGIGSSTSALVAGTGGKGASALGMLGAGAITVALAAGTIAALGAIIKTNESGTNEEAAKSAIWTAQEREDEGWLKSGLHDIGKAFTAGTGTVKKGIGQIIGSKSTEAQGTWAQILSKMGTIKDEREGLLFRLAALMLYDKGGVLQYTNASENHADIVSKYNKLSQADKDIVREWAIELQDSLMYIRGYDKKIIDPYSIDWSNYHKAGLNWVPRDNYKALLHKGEMVLPENEAKAYRELKAGVGGESDALFNNQQKILYNRVVPSSADVTGIGKEFGLPSNWVVTTAYGTYTNIWSGNKRKQHRGVDFAASQGTEMRAANPGLVIFSGTDGGFGNSIVIKDSNTGLYNRYGHAYKLFAKSGDHVNAGDLIALVGSTGNSTGPHLHYEVDKSNNYTDDINPWPYVTLDMFRR